MFRRRLPASSLALLALLAAGQPALAQGQVRSVVVPAEGGVVVPPRSAPRLAARPAGSGTRIPAAAPPGAVLPADTGPGLAGPVAGLLLPALAGALLGSTMAGSRGGTSGPVRTR
ncbi:hypothetical protein [Muricoccus vinaceus]|uniref:Uncharacterized protein n=1 Tax=Muricoccus vinaceus TaxID=424704 RepID=A0ABV6IM91_9PROT